MKLFGRNKSENNEVPEDLQQYYSTGGSGLVKWIVRILVGLIVLALLIWGGTWLVHKMTDKTKTPQTTQSSSQQSEAQKRVAAQAQAAQKKAQQEAQKVADDAKKLQADQQKAADDAKKAEEAKQKAALDAQKQQAAATPAAPAPGGSGSNLPNTGPGESLLAVFLGASILGAAAHTLATRRHQLR
jgi:cytoskeletal protein RodZ